MINILRLKGRENAGFKIIEISWSHLMRSNFCEACGEYCPPKPHFYFFDFFSFYFLYLKYFSYVDCIFISSLFVVFLSYLSLSLLILILFSCIFSSSSEVDFPYKDRQKTLWYKVKLR
jgi:hypothetical protein